MIARYLSPRVAPMSILEYGCGLGRLALPLARRPGSVTAVDRSPVMLDLARREAERRARALSLSWRRRLFAPRRARVRSRRLLPRPAAPQPPRRHGASAPVDRPHRTGRRRRVPVKPHFRAYDSHLVAASRWARELLPGANALANVLRGKPAADPFIPTHIYDLDEMLGKFDLEAFRSTYAWPMEHYQAPRLRGHPRAQTRGAVPIDGRATPGRQ